VKFSGALALLESFRGEHGFRYESRDEFEKCAGGRDLKEVLVPGLIRMRSLISVKIWKSFQEE